MNTVNSLPAGLDDRSVELFAMNDVPMALYNKRIICFWDLPRHIIESFRRYMDKKPNLQHYLKIDKIEDNTEKLERFVLLVFGKFDNNPDYYKGDINPEVDIYLASIAYGLSDREIDILIRIAYGYSDKDIARELFISESTAAIHRHNIHRKINSRNAADITRFAYQQKILA